MDIFDLKPLTTENLIVLGGSIIILIGWVVTHLLNRKFEIYKRRLDKQDEAFDNVLIIIKHIIDKGTLDTPDIHLQLAKARSLLQLYGDLTQIEAYEGFINAIEIGNLEKANIAFNQLTKVIVQSKRKGLGLSNYDRDIR